MSAEVKPGYKQTEIGVIPEDWRVERVGDIATVSSGGTPSRTNPNYWGGDIPWITTTQVDFNVIREAQQYITRDGLENSAAKMLPPGTLLLALYGQGKTRGKVSMLGVAATTNQACASISISDPVLAQFTFNYLTSQYEAIRASSNGGSQDNLSGGIVKQLQIPVPPRLEQPKITSALSDMDALIASLDQLIAKKRDIQQATIQQLLTGQRRLPGFSGEWKDGELRDVVRSLEAGVSVNSSDDLPEPGLPCVLKTSALSGGNFFPNEAKAIVAADRGRACTNPKRNTILISRMNTPALVGEIAYVGKNYDWLFLPDRLWMTRFMSDDCVNARWLSYLLSSRPYRRLLQDSATGTSGSMKNISKGVLLNLKISYPAIEEQTAIATILSDMDTELTALEARREKARQLKQGMMQELLTGRIRLA
ncbi:restriction endonuclease subunit S [Stutzerimonas nitrititolerans]|uniref:restriction endonuclease subunit S n=1 Tax=Stutzerimonas nitrititolerans TaxID=2482751 RepID=UPI0028A1BFB0|nr:restriction endonuclease subunit S [Stutzerimonas nitrititolerans]